MTVKFDKNIIREMRSWIADCSWKDLEPEDIADLTDDEVIAGVRANYDGGTAQFLRDMA